MAKIVVDSKEEAKELGLAEAKKVSKPKGKKEDLKKLGETNKKVFVDVDNSFEDVIEYLNDGADVYFDDAKGRLIQLTPEEVKELPYNVKGRYRMARSISSDSLRFENPDGFREQRLKANPRYASATNRLKIENGNPAMHYAYLRSDEIGQALGNGYQVVDGNDVVETFGENTDGTRTVSSGGVDELILMKIPEDDFQGHLKAVEDVSKKRKSAIEKTTLNEMAKDGGIPFVPERE